MTGDNHRSDYTDDQVRDIVSKNSYSYTGPSYGLFEERPQVPFTPALFVRITDGEKVRAWFRLVPVYDDAEGVLVDERSGLRVRLEQIEPGIDAGAGDRVARLDRPAVVTYDAGERAARHLPGLQVIYDEGRGTYRFDMRSRSGEGQRARHRFSVRADRLAKLLWKLNEDTVSVDLVRAGLDRLAR